MLQIKLRTEYSFRTAYGPVNRAIDAAEGDAVGICDTGTWGHVAFQRACKEAGKKPIYGVEIAFVDDARSREKQPTNYMSFIAKNNEGLKEIYELVTRSTDNFYYIPRLDYSDLFDISGNVIILSGNNPNWGMLPATHKENLYIEIGPMSTKKCLEAVGKGFKPVAVSDNFYPKVTDKKVYEVLTGRNRQSRTKPMHILSEWELRSIVKWLPDEAIANTHAISEQCDASLPQAQMVRYKTNKTLESLCIAGASELGVDLDDKEYSKRLNHELKMISHKEFEDYFFVIADMVKYARQHMLVGPARGSAAGSLVCYLLGITNVDPIRHDLLFERFIDVTRDDLPDIDIDFQDDRREMVFEYLRNKYGAEKVAHLGTVSRYKAKSTITEVSKELGIPMWEVNDLKGAIIERSGGDSRAAFCILDTFNELDIGRDILEK